MTEREKMLAEMMYLSEDPELVAMRGEARVLCKKFNELDHFEKDEKNKILKELFGTTGKNIYIEPTFRCDYGKNIHVGENFYINFNCTILDVADVRIGANCMIAPNVSIYTATHPIDPIERNSGKEYAKKITIGDNCWIGGNAVICPGVTLGDNVVIGAGSVVTKSFGDNVVLAGNPARIIKTI